MIKSLEEIEIMEEAGRRLARVVKSLSEYVKPGISTKELDRVAKTLILQSGGKCSFLGYQDYPNCLCTSVNEEVVHAIPSNRVLKEGDIISLDLGLLYQGYHSDMAVTLPVGKVSKEALRLIKVNKKALDIGISKVKVGNLIGDIGKAIQDYVEKKGFTVVHEFCGHGIGKDLHEDPQVLNVKPYDKESEHDANIKIQEGMVLCLEPIISLGGWQVKEMVDGFGFETVDGSLTSHFEHTVAITKNRVKVLTMLK